MADIITKVNDSTSIEYGAEDNLRYGTHSRVVSYERTAPKTTGAFINVNGVGQFRRSTAFYHSRGWIEPGSPQDLRGFTTRATSSGPKRVPVRVNASPGGFRTDVQLYGASGDPMFRVSSIGNGGLGQVPNIPEESRNEAITKALNEIANGKANLGETLGTLAQSYRLLANPLGALVNGLKSMKDDKSMHRYLYTSIRNLRKEGIQTVAAKRYIEYVYGWKPLVSEIYGIIEFMKEQGQNPLLLHGRGKAVRSGSSSGGRLNLTSYNATTDVDPMSLDSKVTCNLWATPDPNWGGLRALNRLGLANPLAIAWDLMAWSFVVDWVLPIGPVLNALSAPAGLKFIDGSVANRVSGHGSLTHWYNALDSNATSSVRGTANVRYEGYNRESIRSWPRPGLWVDPDPLRGDRPLKALALAIIQLRR